MARFKIFVKINSNNIIYNVDNYEILETGYYKFFDIKTQTYRILDSRICEIVEEVKQNE